MTKPKEASILLNKSYNDNAVFLVKNLLHKARRQKKLVECDIPAVCVLDPDGDLASYLIEKGSAIKNECRACYHSNLYNFELDGIEIGIIPLIVGGSYAILVAEQLFVSGCKLLISATSAGIINEPKEAKRFALITEAVRDEGISYHYLPKDEPSVIPKELLSVLLSVDDPVWLNAKSWTTDAPYRETEFAIEAMKNEGICCVEMEAASLYAFAQAKQKRHRLFCSSHKHQDAERGGGGLKKESILEASTR
jgi:purine-nucleoside phosphorylase